MNRLSPKIVRNSPSFVPSFAWAGRTRRAQAAAAAAAAVPLLAGDDLEAFTTTFLGGLVFFGTLIA
jgi:hypothetical protein